MMRRVTTILLLIVMFSAVAFATQEKKLARVRITGPGGYLDETTVYFDLGISTTYGVNEDGPKVFSQVQYAPSLYTLTSDGIQVSTNGYSRLSQSETITLGVHTDTAGIYTFSSSIVTNFDSTTIILLEDKLNGTFTNLLTDPYVTQFNAEQVIENRFYLHFSKAVQLTPTTAGCNNNDGQVDVNQDNTVTWSVIELRDTAGFLLEAPIRVNGPYNFSGLAEGDYSVTFKLGSYTSTKLITVPGSYVTIDIPATSLTGNANQPVYFTTTSHNATLYDWKLGDGGQITGIANPDYVYYEPGTYTVVVTASNDAGCTYTDSVTITIGAATALSDVSTPGRNIWSSGNNITIQLNENLTPGAELKVNNLLGQPVYLSPVTQTTTQLQLGNQPTGYYIVSVQNNNVVTTKRLFISR